VRARLLSATLAILLAVALLTQLAGLLGPGAPEESGASFEAASLRGDPLLPVAPGVEGSGPHRPSGLESAGTERSVLGQVLGPDGKPERRARVRLLDPEGVTVEVEADEEGWFRLDGLPPHAVWLEAKTHRHVSGPVLLPAGKVDPLPIWMGPGTRLSGRAASSEGRGLEGLGVSLVIETSIGPAEFETGVRTGLDGRFQIAGLKRGEAVRVRLREKGRLLREMPPQTPSWDEEVKFTVDG
jgi:hypothetical protein